jgi:hypothetical protein
VQLPDVDEHVPLPLQVPAGVSTPLAQVPPHAVPLVGYTHAPDALQSVAPQAPLPVQAAVQQCVPVPPGPQSESVHWSFAVHVAPAAPLATQVPEAPGVEQ